MTVDLDEDDWGETGTASAIGVAEAAWNPSVGTCTPFLQPVGSSSLPSAQSVMASQTEAGSGRKH